MAGETDGALWASFCVIVPMYNEEASAEACARQVAAVLERQPERTALIVVNDGSTDATGEILERMGSCLARLVVVNHRENQGYGAALRTGVRYAAREQFDYALFMDSDLTNNPEDIPRFAAKMRQGFDVIKATRYSLGGCVEGVPAYRVLISALGNCLARRLYGLPIHDCTNGFRAIRVSLLTRMNLRENKFSVIMEELYWAKFLTHSFAEVPVTLTDRKGWQRATSFSYKPASFYRYLKYPVRAFLGRRPRGFHGHEEF